jgi:enamine deaminase RidA (YjgF/YER057c/UK114 family)
MNLNIELPSTNAPAGNYVPALLVGDLVFVSGQTCRSNGQMVHAGKLGLELSVERGIEAARLCGLNVLAQLRLACGSLDRVKRCVKLTVFVNASPDFQEHARVANGASDLMVEVFGEAGRHVRSAVGCTSLPGQSAVEIEAVFQVMQVMP